MESPDVYQLGRVEWQFFGTLTWKSERLPERVRVSMFFALLRRLAGWHRVHFRFVVWALRLEKGEISGRNHFHFLMTSLPAFAVCEATAFAMMAQWEALGGGMARIRIFDRQLNGADYITKCIGIDGADSYESSKFGANGCHLMLSKSFHLLLQSVQRKGERAFRTERQFVSTSH